MICRIWTALPRIAFLIFFSFSSITAQQFHPVGAARGSSGSVFLLTREWTVLAVNLNLSAGSVVGRFKFQPFGYVSDFAVGTVDGKETLFVASNSDALGPLHRGRIQKLTTTGLDLGSCSSKHTISGIAFDGKTDTIYFSSGDSPEIYSVGPGSNTPVFVGELVGRTKLGSISVDPDRRRLYISDLGDGAVISFDLNTRAVVTIGRVGVPQSLLFDPSRPAVVVADSARRQIVIVADEVGKRRNVDLTLPRSFKSPSGLAWNDPTHLVVADELAGTVTLLDMSGHLIYTLPLR